MANLFVNWVGTVVRRREWPLHHIRGGGEDNAKGSHGGETRPRVMSTGVGLLLEALLVLCFPVWWVSVCPSLLGHDLIFWLFIVSCENCLLQMRHVESSVIHLPPFGLPSERKGIGPTSSNTLLIPGQTWGEANTFEEGKRETRQGKPLSPTSKLSITAPSHRSSSCEVVCWCSAKPPCWLEAPSLEGTGDGFTGEWGGPPA